MSAPTNKYPGPCTRCGQPVPAGTGDAPTPDEVVSWEIHDAQDVLFMLGLYDDPSSILSANDRPKTLT